MQSLNRAEIIGNLTRDPELRYTPNGQPVVSFGVATNIVWTDKNGEKQQKTEFHNVVAWRKLAEICSQYLKKGRQVYVEGRLETRNWEGQDGIKRYRTEIIASNVVFLGGRGEDGSTSTEPVAAAPTEDSAKSKKVPSKKASGEEEVNIEDIPF